MMLRALVCVAQKTVWMVREMGVEGLIGVACMHIKDLIKIS